MIVCEMELHACNDHDDNDNDAVVIDKKCSRICH